MLLRLLRRSPPPRRLLRPLCRRFSGPQSSTEISQSLTIPHHPSPPPPLQKPLPLPSKSRRFYFLAGTLASTAAFAGAALLLYSSERHRPEPDKIYGELEQSIERSKHSLRRVLDHMCKTTAAASVLWRSLSSVLSSANHEVRSGFELRVAALLADITAAGSARRSSIVGAGGGAVVDWLLDSVAHSGGDRCGIQAESARALANLIADPNVCKTVLGRPHAVPNLLRFIFSSQPKRLKKQFKYSSLDGPNISKGKSMLVAALMDIITSNCDEIDHSSFRPSLPGNADLGDIAAAIEVVEEGGIHFDDHDGNEDDDNGESGIQGIGIKILGGTTVLGLSRESNLLKLENTDTYHLKSDANLSKNVATQESVVGSPKTWNLTVAAPGLWDDLQREHVAVPFATWALANWALASNRNRSHIQELDSDGHAIMTALTAPERTVKWHGILVARALLADPKLPLTTSVQDWSSSLLSTATQASKVGDIPLAQLALSTFLVSVERSSDAKVFLMEKGLHLLRQIAKQTEKNKDLQEAIARLLELLYSGDMHLSLKESQKWSGILLRWVFGKLSSDTARGSASKILSWILEDYGPDTIPISQGWLSILLSEILALSKASTVKGSSPLKTDKVKTQIDHSNALSAAQVSNQLASAVIKQAGNQLGSEPDSSDTYPLGDFLSIEPFSTLLKNMNKSNISKISAADSAMTTLKGIKALTEICAEDVTYQNKIADFGVLCLLRRFLLGDDYETLAANETYDASRVLETQDRGSTPSGDSATSDSNDSSSVRVPPSAHIRRHAARLLMILSLLPKTKKTIVADEIWCKWLENCANGSIPCCNDPKIQSYARATLLNIFCSDQSDLETVNHKCDATGGNRKNNCPRYEDMVFLINPELPHWNCSDKIYSEDPENPSTAFKSFSSDDSKHPNDNEYTDSRNNAMSVPEHYSSTGFQEEAPLLDVVFIHGLRGGPFKSWRIADNKSSTTTKAGLVEKIDQEAGKQGTFWPREWLAADFPRARLFTVKYKTNLTQWSGASLPLQEVSSMLLQKLLAASIGDRPVIFVTHSMGGLVVKQMLYQAKLNNFNNLVNNTIGVVFYSCPHFGSKLADMPWRMGLVFRPAPSIGELRSGSERLVELNDFLRHLHNKGLLEVLSFSETQVTPIVEGYGGWAFRMEVVPIESAYPGFGELVVLDGTDHINSCKPVNRTDPSYAETLEFLRKLEARIT